MVGGRSYTVVIVEIKRSLTQSGSNKFVVNHQFTGCKPELSMMYAGTRNVLQKELGITKVTLVFAKIKVVYLGLSAKL